MLIYRFGLTLGNSPVVAAGLQSNLSLLFSLFSVQFIVTENSYAQKELG